MKHTKVMEDEGAGETEDKEGVAGEEEAEEQQERRVTIRDGMDPTATNRSSGLPLAMAQH